MSLKKLAKNTFSNSTSLFVRMAISYMLTPILINNLGSEAYGVWMLMATFTLAGSLSLFSFGFQGALVKYVAEFHTLNKLKEINELFSATFIFFTSMAAICAVGLSFFSYFFLERVFEIPVHQVPDAQVVLFIFAVMAIFDLPGMAISAIIEGIQRYDILAALDIGRIAIFCGAAIVILKRGSGVVPLALALASSTIFYTVALAICTKKLLPSWRIELGADRKNLRELFVFSRDLFILRVNGLIYNNMDKMIVGMILGTVFVTEYDIANRIHAIALMVMGLAPSAVLPAASAFDAANDNERQTKLLLQGSKYTTAMALPIVLTLFILAEGLIKFWISPQYAHVALYARLFLLYMLFWPIIQVGWNMLVGVNKIKSIVPLQTFSVAVNLILSIILVKYIGVSGTMIGTIFANLLIFFAYMRLITDTFKVPLGHFIKTVVVPAYSLGLALFIVLFAVVVMRQPESLIQVGVYALISILVYYTGFFVFCIDRKEQVVFTEMYRNLQSKISQALLGRA